MTQQVAFLLEIGMITIAEFSVSTTTCKSNVDSQLHVLFTRFNKYHCSITIGRDYIDVYASCISLRKWHVDHT